MADAFPSSLEDLPDGSIHCVLGTRPEIIKFAPLIKALGRKAKVVHTGQHYDANLSQVFLDQFDLGQPEVFLEVGGQSRGSQIGRVVDALDSHLAQTQPAAVVVQGDTNSVLGGAIAANAREVPLVHLEAGLRSFDRAMPEEHNRVVADHLADLCLAPTAQNVENLQAERVDPTHIELTGNTVVEALELLRPSDLEVERMLSERRLTRDDFVLCTLHRPENVDSPDSLYRILRALERCPKTVYLPMHPRTRARVNRFGRASRLENVRIVDPVDYVTFLGLQSAAALIVADSGGVQEEVTVVKRRLLVVRNSTERPESLGTFARLVRPQDDLDAAVQQEFVDHETRRKALQDEPSPYGDGSASGRSVRALARLLGPDATPSFWS